MEALIIALTPVAVSAFTQLAKVLAGLSYRYPKSIRLITAFASYIGAVGTASLEGTEVPLASVEVLALAVLNFLGATGVYFFAKR